MSEITGIAGEKAPIETAVESNDQPRARGDVQMAASGYGAHGASTTKNSMIGWMYQGGSAEDDIDLHGSVLRQRARDLYTGGGLGRAAPATMVTNVVGWGVKPKPQIDGEVLGLSDEACEEWQRNTLREFMLWAGNPMCDATRKHSFWAMQELAFRSQLMSGDVFVLFAMSPNARTPYQTVIRLIEADRVSTPDSNGDSMTQNLTNGRIIDGIEVDKNGAVVRYHISSYHPLAEDAQDELTWQAIDAFGKDTGLPNILHLSTSERPEQQRGVPFVAPMIESIKQLDRYITSELAAQIVASMLAIFLTSENDTPQAGIRSPIDDDDKVTDSPLHLELTPGMIVDLPPGKKVANVNPIRNNTAFEAFVTKMIELVGATVGIPYEVLMKKYDSNYTASRNATLDFWQEVTVYRTRFNDGFNQPIYEQWLAEAVALGRVKAPGFFDDPAKRAAWCGCMWMGAAKGHVDPVKEVRAASMRVAMNMTTEQQEAMAYNGNDWNANVRQRRKELAAQTAAAPKTDSQNANEPSKNQEGKDQ